MSIIFALALAAEPAQIIGTAPEGAPTECLTSYRGRWPRESWAMCHFARLSQYPELVRFRKVHWQGAYLCGEIDAPQGKSMSGFYTFVYLDERNFARRTREGLFASINDRADSSSHLNNYIARARRKGDDPGIIAWAGRKAKFEAAANELMAHCA